MTDEVRFTRRQSVCYLTNYTDQIFGTMCAHFRGHKNIKCPRFIAYFSMCSASIVHIRRRANPLAQ